MHSPRHMLLVLGVIALLAASALSAEAPPIWLDPSVSFERRADELLKQMTVEEKVSQLSTASPAIPRLNVTEFAWWAESLHGMLTWEEGGGTLFPQPLGLAAAFDPDMMHAISTQISDEMRARDNKHIMEGQSYKMTNSFGPNINIYRDPRWGRGSETFGEDPHLTAALAKRWVHGLQGDDKTYTKIRATCKHFAAYSLEEWEGISRYAFDAVMDNKDLHETYLPAFRACVVEGGAGSVMCSYNAVNGVPTCASELLLKDILRGDWDFDGFVVSDCGAIASIYQAHEYTKTDADGYAVALQAGNDLICVDSQVLNRSFKDGRISEEDLDTAVRRALLARFKSGHFDPLDATPWGKLPFSVIGSDKHLSMAREALQKGIVLLKNAEGDDGKKLLPLDKKAIKKVVVLGPLANTSEYMLGNYYGLASAHITTPLEAITSALKEASPDAIVEYEIGVYMVGWNLGGVENAVYLCREADVCIFCVGSTSINPYSEQGHSSGDYPMYTPALEGEGLDRTSILITPAQKDLVLGVAKRTSTPIVALLLHGGPLDVQWMQESDRVGAILTAWYPGQGAAAIADVLFGDVSPSGRLPVTFPYENYTSQISFADMRMRKWPGRTHRYLQVPVLYPFGYGLSYTTFKYDQLIATDRGARIDVSLKVSNTGGMAADEVVLLYMSQSDRNMEEDPPHLSLRRDVGAKEARLRSALGSAQRAQRGDDQERDDELDAPLQTLAGFQRVQALHPGQTAEVRFTLTPEHFLAYSGEAGGMRVREGEYLLWAGDQQHYVLVTASMLDADQ